MTSKTFIWPQMTSEESIHYILWRNKRNFDLKWPQKVISKIQILSLKKKAYHQSLLHHQDLHLYQQKLPWQKSDKNQKGSDEFCLHLNK